MGWGGLLTSCNLREDPGLSSREVGRRESQSDGEDLGVWY